MRANLIFFVLILFLWSCGEESIPSTGDIEGKEYFPIADGRSWTYSYDSIIYDESLNKIINLSGFIREDIGDTLDDGRLTLQRYWRRDSTDNWDLSDVWTITDDNSRVIRTEENLSFIKLVFPPRKGITWDGNVFFNNELEITVAGETLQPYLGWEYEISDIEGIYDNRGIYTDKVITVLQVDDESFLDRRYSIEQFAPEIGLVYKEMHILDCQCIGVDPTIPWEVKAEKGFILRQELIAFQ